MRVLYEPIAERELSDAAHYLARRASSVAAGYDLLDDAAATEQLIMQFPEAWPQVGRGLRKCLLRKHDYQIVYRVEGEFVRVFAFAHQRRKPGYWRKRLKP